MNSPGAIYKSVKSLFFVLEVQGLLKHENLKTNELSQILFKFTWS
jgi:hypothetical protein